ncbi:MAG: LacI family DNA-binding transcriptional regulator [Blautia sp.]|nr:LacI family DNA-binding transcriptional regulator [Blautia sp.]
MAGTMKQIAELSGVSRGTVDRVLNNRGRVNPEVAVRVREAARQIGYKTKTERKELLKQDRERGLRPVRRIGVVTQLSGASFMLSIRKGLEEAKKDAQAYGIEVVIKECPGVDEEQQCEALDELEELGVDGLAIMPVECDGVRDRLRHMIRDLDVRVITFNTDIIGTRRTAFVGMDNRQGGRTAAGLLGILMHGRGSVLGVIGSFSNSTSLLRLDGFSEELARSFPDISLIGISPSMDRQEEVASIIRNSLKSHPDLGGIFMVSSGQLGIRDALEDPEVKSLLATREDGRRPYIIIYDLTPRNRTLLGQDLVDFVIDQDGYNQGLRAVMSLVDLLASLREPEQEYLYTDITVRTKYTSPEIPETGTPQ